MQSRTMARKPTGRVTLPKGAAPKARPTKPAKGEKWIVQDSRSVRTPWIWRGFLALAMLAVGVALILNGNHHGTLAVLWLVIAAGWTATALWLWRKHRHYMDG